MPEKWRFIPGTSQGAATKGPPCLCKTHRGQRVRPALQEGSRTARSSDLAPSRACSGKRAETSSSTWQQLQVLSLSLQSALHISVALLVLYRLPIRVEGFSLRHPRGHPAAVPSSLTQEEAASRERPRGAPTSQEERTRPDRDCTLTRAPMESFQTPAPPLFLPRERNGHLLRSSQLVHPSPAWSRVEDVHEGKSLVPSRDESPSRISTPTLSFATNGSVAPFGSHVSLAVTERTTVVFSSTAKRYA